MSVFYDISKVLLRNQHNTKILKTHPAIDLILANNPKCFQSSCIVETGLSDFHRMTVAVMKTTFKKFNQGQCTTGTIKIEFLSIFMVTLEQNAPFKQKYTRGNHLPFMSKTISKEIIKRTRLQNQCLRNRADENKSRYKKQRNYCVTLLRKTKTQYYSNFYKKKCY